jgi:hypothetical protein
MTRTIADRWHYAARRLHALRQDTQALRAAAEASERALIAGTGDVQTFTDDAARYAVAHAIEVGFLAAVHAFGIGDADVVSVSREAELLADRAA